MQTLAQIESRLAEIKPELLELTERDELDEAGETRLSELNEEWDALMEERPEAEKREKRVAQVKSYARTTRTESGADAQADRDADPFGDPDSLRDPSTIRNPWDMDEVRSIAAFDPERANREVRARALSAIERASGLNDAHRQRATKLVESFDEESPAASALARRVLATSSPTYQRAFSRAVRSLLQSGQADPEAVTVLQRAMSTTNASGGFAVPLPIDPTILFDDAGSTNPFRQISRVVTIGTDQIRFVSSDVPSASWDGEASEVSDDTGTFSNTDITAHKAQSFVPFSVEIGGDFPNLTQHLGRQFAFARDDLEAAAFATGAGDGSNEPVGIVTALQGGSFEVSSNSTDTFALSDVYDLEEELPARFRANASWVANKRIYQAMREAGGANLDDFWANLGQGQPRELLGYPTYEASEMDGTITGSSENRVLVFGDFSNYVIVDRVGLNVELVPHVFATGNNRPSGQRGLYAWWRVGADSVLDRAFRLLNVT